MPKIIVKDLKIVLGVQSHSRNNARMMNFLENSIKNWGPEYSYYFKKDNMYITKGKVAKGEFYPCVVAHTDTVHAIVPNFTVIQNNGFLFAMNLFKQTGIGGDDKVGIYIALEMLRNLPALKVAFFIDEEIGCVGSGKADPAFFEDVGYILQADRKGAYDITETISDIEMNSEAFRELIEPAVKKYERKYVDGMMTDVLALSRKFDISMMNISCGYYGPHTDREYVCIQDVANTFNFMYDVIKMCGNKEYPCAHKDFGEEMRKKNLALYDSQKDKKGLFGNSGQSTILATNDAMAAFIPDNLFQRSYYDLVTRTWTDQMPMIDHTFYYYRSKMFHVPRWGAGTQLPTKKITDIGQFYIPHLNMWTVMVPSMWQIFYDEAKNSWNIPAGNFFALSSKNEKKSELTQVQDAKRVAELDAKIAAYKAHLAALQDSPVKISDGRSTCLKCGSEPHPDKSRFSENYCPECKEFFSEVRHKMKMAVNNKTN